jgi:hypothetical protein
MFSRGGFAILVGGSQVTVVGEGLNILCIADRSPENVVHLTRQTSQCKQYTCAKAMHKRGRRSYM